MFNLSSPSYTYEEPPVLPPPPPPTLEEMKEQLKNNIVYEASRRQEALISGYSSAERNTWERKEQEAKILIETGDIKQAKYLTMEAVAFTGSTDELDILAATTSLASVVIAKADYLRSRSAKISGNRARLHALASALETSEEAESFDYSQGWD